MDTALAFLLVAMAIFMLTAAAALVAIIRDTLR